MAASKKLHHLSVQLLSVTVRGLWESMDPIPGLWELGTSQNISESLAFLLPNLTALLNLLDVVTPQVISGGPICDDLLLNINWDKNSRHFSQEKLLWHPKSKCEEKGLGATYFNPFFCFSPHSLWCSLWVLPGLDFLLIFLLCLFRALAIAGRRNIITILCKTPYNLSPYNLILNIMNLEYSLYINAWL